MVSDPHLTLVDHPIVQDRLAVLRNKTTAPQQFRTALHEISRFLAVEASRNLPQVSKTISTPLADMEAQVLSEPTPLIIPILRAGLGLASGFQEVMPEADTGHVGLYRDEDTKRPVQYLVKLPNVLDRPILVVDPMLATGHSMIATIDILVSSGAKASNICCSVLLGAPEGLAELRKAYPEIHVYTAAMDSHLNESAYIVPGLGDAGDRYFGTV